MISLARRLVRQIGSCLAFFAAVAATAAPVKFDIPGQSAPTALKAFIQQSGASVMFALDDLKDV